MQANKHDTSRSRLRPLKAFDSLGGKIHRLCTTDRIKRHVKYIGMNE